MNRKEKSIVVKRAISIRGRNSSVSLEEPFWSGLKEIAAERGVPLSELVAQIDKARKTLNLSSAIRQFVGLLSTKSGRTLDLTALFWTKLCEKVSLERSFGHAEEEVQCGADRGSATPD